jgi:hypothetical protein
MTDNILSEYISEEDFARQQGISVRTLSWQRRYRKGPPWTKIGRKVFYRRSAIAAWLLSREQGGEPDERRRYKHR